MNDDDDCYTPIDYDLYSSYEMAIMRHDRLRIYWLDASGGAHIEGVVPLDIELRNGGEYLIVERRSGAILYLRLDRILRAKVAGTVNWKWR